MSGDKLDKLLKTWAANRAPGEAHLDRLAAGIVEEGSRRSATPLCRDEAPSARTSMRGKLIYATLGAATALAIVVAVSAFFPAQVEICTGMPAEAVPAISPSEVEAGARLFREVSQVFGDSLRWMTDTENKVRLGVDSDFVAHDVNAPRLLIRVVVVGRNNGESQWRTLMKTDVLTYDQEWVEAIPDPKSPDPKSPDRLILWGNILPDGNVAVDSSLRLSVPIRMQVDVTNVFTPGQPAEVFSIETADAQYRVFQAVTPLQQNRETPCTEI